MAVEYHDYTSKCVGEIRSRITNAVEAIGDAGEGYAVKNLMSGGLKHPTGALSDSVTHEVEINGDHYTAIVGTNKKYGVYLELGTGKYYAGGGRKGYWVFVPGSGGGGSGGHKIYTLEKAKQVMAILRKKGIEAYYTDGMRPHPWLKPVLNEHGKDFLAILKQYLSD